MTRSLGSNQTLCIARITFLSLHNGFSQITSQMFCLHSVNMDQVLVELSGDDVSSSILLILLRFSDKQRRATDIYGIRFKVSPIFVLTLPA